MKYLEPLIYRLNESPKIGDTVYVITQRSPKVITEEVKITDIKLCSFRGFGASISVLDLKHCVLEYFVEHFGFVQTNHLLKQDGFIVVKEIK